MPWNKIDPQHLQELVEEGKGVTEIAKELGVHKGSVSKALKRLGIAISKDVTLRGASRINAHKLDAMAQLQRINRLVNTELGYIEGFLKDAGEGPTRELFQKQQLAHVAEIRKQISLFVDIARVLWNAEQVAEFQKTVLEVIGEVDGSVRTEITKRLVERGALVRSVGWPA